MHSLGVTLAGTERGNVSISLLPNSHSVFMADTKRMSITADTRARSRPTETLPGTVYPHFAPVLPGLHHRN